MGMKTKKLIELLQSQDPSGKLEVLIDNADINGVYKIPMYYDGPGQTILRDNRGYPTGIKFLRKGEKVSISTYSAEDMLLDHPEMGIIDLSEIKECSSKENYEYYFNMYESERQENLKIIKKIEDEARNAKKI
jgi:hypothetical protein